VGLSGSVVVAKDRRVAALGFRLAVRRLKRAIAEANADEVYIYLFEAANWAATFEELSSLKGDADFRAVTFARNRGDHHWASTAFRDPGSGEWVWRPASQLPEDARYPDKDRRQLYERRLENEPVLKVLERLDPKIAAAVS
jgi:hypothetical protein